MLVDSHCHLDFPDFTDDLDAVVGRAKDAGVGLMQTISTRLSAFDEILAIAQRFENVFCSVGVHPHHAADESEVTAARILALSRDRKVIGIGETGLDYHYQYSPRERQQECFRAHIAAARDSGLPLIVHSRDADADTIEILTEEMGKGAFPGLIHCFSAGMDVAEMAVELGMYVSFSGILTFNKAEAVRAVAAALPPERILVETDAPYLAPMPRRGKRNEPAYVAHTAARLATILGLGEAETAALTTANFHRLFAKAPAAAEAP